ncbi:glyoxalase superfamily protein [Breoghania sp.]|uniref:glyoxalase superfamily protein n=1 Tax=Breoghania sp. TaxID=2065378 RepID=UPI0029C9D3BC|nr:glyoxalase superfamily protein [Breoghania sp.]
MNGIIPTLDEAKRQAKRLRADMAASGTDLSHGRSLEIVAHQHGYRDWNTFHAAIGNGPPREEARRTCAPVEIGQTVRGTYLGQPFLGQVLSVHMMGTPARYAVEIDFDEPVDVVTFDSFSSFRKRVRTTVDAAGVSTSKTSDGEPHMRLIL